MLEIQSKAWDCLSLPDLVHIFLSVSQTNTHTHSLSLSQSYTYTHTHTHTHSFTEYSGRGACSTWMPLLLIRPLVTLLNDLEYVLEEGAGVCLRGISWLCSHRGV